MSAASRGVWLAYGFHSVYKKIRVYMEVMQMDNLESWTMRQREVDDVHKPGMNGSLKNNC